MKRALILGAAIVGMPMATAFAGPHDPISSSGEDLSAVEVETMGRVSRSNPGMGVSLDMGEIDDALASRAGGAMSEAKLEWLATLKPMTAPKGVESIIGKDTRKQVKDTTKYPYRAVVLILFDGARCTGWMISPNTVATAGHCVYDPGIGFYPVGTYEIVPGYTGSSAPYGSCGATTLHTVTGWANSGNDQYDYGAIKLDCNIGTTVGWFGYYWTKKSSQLLKRKVTITGYPGDKPYTMWFGKGKTTAIEKRRVFYKIDTVGGQSGSPVYHKKKKCGQCSIAVHAYGVGGSGPSGSNNHGTRIVKAVFKNFNKWKKN